MKKKGRDDCCSKHARERRPQNSLVKQLAVSVKTSRLMLLNLSRSSQQNLLVVDIPALQAPPSQLCVVVFRIRSRGPTDKLVLKLASPRHGSLECPLSSIGHSETTTDHTQNSRATSGDQRGKGGCGLRQRCTRRQT